MYGWTGKVLRVDLTKGDATEEDLDIGLAKKFIGGQGLAAKILSRKILCLLLWFGLVSRGMPSLCRGGVTPQSSGFYPAVPQRGYVRNLCRLLVVPRIKPGQDKPRKVPW